MMIKEPKSAHSIEARRTTRGFGAAVGHRRIALSRDGRKPRRYEYTASSEFRGPAGIVYFTARAACSRYWLMRMQETDTSDENIKDLVAKLRTRFQAITPRFRKNFVIRCR